MNLKAWALELLSKNPNVSNNPRAQEYIKIIQNGDSEQGERIANNLCQTYGMSKEDAVKNAKNFFGVN